LEGTERAKAAVDRLKKHGRIEHLGRPRLVIDRAKVGKLHGQGLSVKEIAKRLRISPATAHRIIRSAW
jgi:DNA-binding NarL/FixJ family response regulator